MASSAMVRLQDNQRQNTTQSSHKSCYPECCGVCQKVTQEHATTEGSHVCVGVRSWPCWNHVTAKKSRPAGNKPPMRWKPAPTWERGRRKVSWRSTLRRKVLSSTERIY